MYKLEFKFTLPVFFMSFSLVILLLGFFAGAFEFYRDIVLTEAKTSKISEEKNDKVFKVDMRASLMLSHQGIKGLGRDDAEVYMLKVSKKKTGLGSLFEKIKMAKEEKTLKVMNHQQAKKGSVGSIPNYSALLNDNEKVAMNEKAIRKMVKSKTHLFRSCYNKMLLKDALLSGVVTINISESGNGSSVFKGIGRSKVIKELKNCLNSQVKKINLSKINLTKKIRFSLNFSS